jgi:hypothetical protein
MPGSAGELCSAAARTAQGKQNTDKTSTNLRGHFMNIPSLSQLHRAERHGRDETT